MSREIAAVSLGILGLGLTYISYKIFTSDSSVAKPSTFFGKRKIKPVALKRKDKRFDKVGKTVCEKIKTIETQCFKGVNNALSLGVKDIDKLKSRLVARWLINEEDTSDLVTLTDILMTLRHNGVLGPTNYLENVTIILQDIGIGLNQKSKELLNILRDGVIDHIEADIQNQNKTAWDSDSKKIDIYVLYSQDDFDMAQTFQQNIYRYVSTKDVNVVLMDDVGHGMTIFRAFEQGLKSSIYTFVLVTETFIKDEVKKFLAGTGLIENLQSSARLWRLVPVWMDSGINESGKCPLEFAMLQGLRYDRFLENKGEITVFKNIDRLLKKGRKREMDEGLREEMVEGD
ncbi:uncharacterized protein LOC110440508 [Mizuhopecten yessoensis]|uniref:TIR domain-containing protein n=1 Tax=Mizuhopecten yessoensis TaxID=6573 RepID=A0A210R1F0_MIZYE|nr:uncharacterized protein LOC110440508 [Mizuhopecten yessoensis]OWF54774.1 hypothetical protein KP79_PYT21859 [Mizuhopecten yessoensis]